MPNTDRLIHREQSNVEDVDDRSNSPKGCNAMYLEDLEARSNIPKGRNALYVEDVEDWNIHTHFKYCVYYSMSKMSKIDQVHLRAVILWMSKVYEDVNFYE